MGSLIWVLIIGAVAGFLAGLIFKGKGFGFVLNILIGIVGSFLGSFLFGKLGISIGSGIWGELIAAVVGALIFLWILSLIMKKKK